MKKYFLLIIILSITIGTASFAQSTSSPEVPKNYKPKAKVLMPMPAELTDEMIFPVLGKYEYRNDSGNVAQVTITRDFKNEGIIWVNGMQQGKFRADLRLAPATYKIPAQKTLQNDVDSIVVSTNNIVDGAVQSEARLSGETLKEGTLLFDTASNKLYINVGAKFDEKNPSDVFSELVLSDSAVISEVELFAGVTAVNNSVKDTDKKEYVPKGVNYVLTKIVAMDSALILKEQ